MLRVVVPEPFTFTAGTTGTGVPPMTSDAEPATKSRPSPKVGVSSRPATERYSDTATCAVQVVTLPVATPFEHATTGVTPTLLAAPLHADSVTARSCALIDAVSTAH